MYTATDKSISHKLQWNPSTSDTIRNQHIVLYREVLGASDMFAVGMVCIIVQLSTTWLHFQSLLLLYTVENG